MASRDREDELPEDEEDECPECGLAWEKCICDEEEEDEEEE